LGREERTKVAERSDAGEGCAHGSTLTLVALRPDLSHIEREKGTRYETTCRTKSES
jgi:hypothetical protein